MKSTMQDSREASLRPRREDKPVAPPGMVQIPAGPFFMGSEEGGEFERPVHEVLLRDFWMDETLVTNGDFQRFVRDTGYLTNAECVGHAWGYEDGVFAEVAGLSWQSYTGSSREDHPVVLVSWDDAVAYANWAGKRLPTEAEWEKAARGGLSGKPYPWGEAEPDGSRSVFARTPADPPPTASVREFPPNDDGLYQMVGNVWQWCSDWYGDRYYAEACRDNPTGPGSGQFKVRRGGSWNVIQSFRLRCANRGAVDRSTAVPNLGFRCALSVDEN